MAKDLYIRQTESTQRVQDYDLKVVGSLTIPTIDEGNEDEQIENGIGIKNGVPSWFDGAEWIPLGSTGVYLTETSPYYSSGSGGVISIPAFNTDFPIMSTNQVVRMQGWAMVDGNIFEFDLQPVTTRNAGGDILTATFNLGQDGATITKLKARIY